MNSVKSSRFYRSRTIVRLLFLLIVCGSSVVQPLSIVALASPQTAAANSKFTRADELFLDDLQHRSFNYFWEEANPETGLVPDRARVDGSTLDENHQNVASIAATGFGLTALVIAAERNWITRSQAQERTRKTLLFFANKAFQQHGWFYHWLDAKTGERRWQSEVSSIDTALLLAGVLTTRQYFGDDPEISKLAT